MFKEFVFPYLQEQCSRLGFTLYHLIGPEAIRHLDQLLKIPELTAIQWVPGAGNPPNESPTCSPFTEKYSGQGNLYGLVFHLITS